MKNNTTNRNEIPENNQSNYLNEVSRQVDLAFKSKDTPPAVKDCLETIIGEASDEAGLPLTDFSLVREALPNVIEKLPFEFGRGILASIAAIIRHDTKAYREFYDQPSDEPAAKTEAQKGETPTNYQLLQSKLDNGAFARVFQEKQIERAKQLIADILMVTCGGSHTREGCEEYGQENLYLLMDIFMIRHENYKVFTVAEEIQYYLHTWTESYTAALFNWSEKVCTDRGFDKTGIDLKLIAEIEAEVAK